ncbi:helix-hairpin-helix domain-containing protein [Schnuerera sp. xch1]|uniref:helix-hairpin-helix domain-containing protein n=1 Tax=Schnuerera sp. xch1 TaxID=2874283 RepID=UPI001CBC0A5F|nr:helix-hairpin-helix domain-containing protein [Schnuerera sp. xch1]MBZ2175364.1 helix-hairpin-helix domain-containing protein [Schnuerera sp. xch1]
MSYFSKKEQIIVILIVVIIVIISIFNFLNKNISLSEEDIDSSEIDQEEFFEELETEEIAEQENHDIMVHISGQVYKPGLVELKSGDRVTDAVNLAGGLKKDADLDKINLAKKLSDEEKIYIPKIGEEDIDSEVLNLDNSHDIKGKININTCTKEQLLSLPGIGEALAGRIVEYREQNLFKNVEDIMNVSGIGDKKFESIRELIIVN